MVACSSCEAIGGWAKAGKSGRRVIRHISAAVDGAASGGWVDGDGVRSSSVSVAESSSLLTTFLIFAVSPGVPMAIAIWATSSGKGNGFRAGARLGDRLGDDGKRTLFETVSSICFGAICSGLCALFRLIFAISIRWRRDNVKFFMIMVYYLFHWNLGR